MKIRAQIGMVMNLDKCIGCHKAAPPAPALPPRREGGRTFEMHLSARRGS